MIYFIAFAYLLFCVIAYDVCEKKQHLKSHYMVLYLLFTLVAGLRWRLGVDTVNYMNYFNLDVLPLSELSWEYISESRYQPFWVLLNSICKSLGGFVFVQLFTSAFFHAAMFYFFYVCCKKPFTALSIFYIYNYFYFSMEIMRESLAISCFLFGIINLNKDSLIKYYIWAFLAFMWHFFAVFLFVLPPFFSLFKKGISLNKFILSLIVLFILWINLKERIFELALNFVPPNIGNKIIRYFHSDEYGTFSWNVKGFVYNMFPLFIVFFFAFVRRRLENRNILKIEDWVWGGCILYSIFSLFCLDMKIFIRFTNYFYLFFVVLLASCLYIFRFERKSKIVFAICVMLCILFPRLYSLMGSDFSFDAQRLPVHPYAAYYPYTSIFDKKEPMERRILHSYWGDK